MSPDWIEPDWPAPPNVRSATTLRAGGVSLGPYASLNLGSHVGDDPAAVTENRRRIREALKLPAEPAWLNQAHGTAVVEATAHVIPPTADAAIAKAVDRVCVVLTADCLPVLFCDRAGTRVAAAHAGWRGLAGGVLEATLAALGNDHPGLMAWLGPAIEQDAFEV
ncbi:MAG: polyphenol oxidase family protein, partial [Longimicrobiales bacterium]